MWNQNFQLTATMNKLYLGVYLDVKLNAIFPSKTSAKKEWRWLHNNNNELKTGELSVPKTYFFFPLLLSEKHDKF